MQKFAGLPKPRITDGVSDGYGVAIREGICHTEMGGQVSTGRA